LEWDRICVGFLVLFLLYQYCLWISFLWQRVIFIKKNNTWTTYTNSLPLKKDNTLS
jgi:hypothetical protein